jgi:glycolate oxidase FAD binding subunit
LAAVSGRGETFKSGGRVVKNVTGYDLCKLVAGSWGTLAALTEVTIKTLPRPDTEATVAVAGLEDAAAVRAMTAAMGSSCDVSGAAHLPAAVAGAVPLVGAAGSGRAMTLLRLEGVAPSVAHRQAALTEIVKPFGEVGILTEPASQAAWHAVRDVLPFAASRTGTEQPLWRVSTAPTRGAELTRMIAAATDADCLYDWAGGLLWLSIADGGDDAGATAVRRAVAACGGHATLVRAPAALRAAVEPFEPLDAGLAALTKRVKEGFDPKGVFNTGRMWAGV